MRGRRFPRRPPPPDADPRVETVETSTAPPPPSGNPWIVVALLAVAVVAVGIVALVLLAGRGDDAPDGEEQVTVVEVPPVVGLSEADAVERVREAGFQPEVAYEVGTEPAGTVVGQRPEGGVALEPGATVVVRVGAGETEPER